MNINTAIKTQSQHQPLGTWVMFFLQIIGFVGFMMVFALLVLYCTNKLGLSDTASYAISAAFNALAFATSVPTAIVAERYLGFRFASTLSIAICAIGLFVMCITTTLALYIGLGIFILGTGMLVPCFFVLLGRIYTKNDAYREWGFTLSYMGMNVGGFFAAIASGYVAEYLGYNAAFLIGAIAYVIMLPLFIGFQKLYAEKERNQHGYIITFRTRQFGLLLIAILAVLTILLVYFADVCNSLLLILGVACVLFMLRLAFKVKTPKEKRNLLIFAVLISISVMFWTLYSLAPSALTLFTERNVNRNVLNHIIPASDFSSLNNFFIFTLGPVIAFIWIKFQKKGAPVSTATKIATGTLLMGLGYLVLVPGIAFSNSLGYMGIAWLVLSYFFQTTGELMVGPVNYAMVGEFVPAKLEGTMMGISQLSTGVGGALSAYFADYTNSSSKITNPLLTNHNYSHAFMLFGSLTVVVALVAYGIAFYIRKKDTAHEPIIFATHKETP